MANICIILLYIKSINDKSYTWLMKSIKYLTYGCADV